MKLSRHWLDTVVRINHSDAELSHLLTMGGLEVEAVDPVAPSFDRVVVAEVVHCEAHPQADRLKLCGVRVNHDPTVPLLQIVCGAPNVAAGVRVPCALVGASLPVAAGAEPFVIRAAKVRGIESHGMLCSARELGLSDDADGLLLLEADAPVGSSLRDYLDLDDRVFTLKLTPNRGDCLSLKGLAREVAAITGAALALPSVASVLASPLPSPAPAVRLEVLPACPYYLGRVIRLARRPAQSPLWLRRRLERSGLRPIEPVVDATNYGLVALGHPTHAFDRAALQGDLQVRFGAADGSEQLTLLNGQAVAVRPDTLLIADATGPLALAGVMGGQASSVTADTGEIFLECAWFVPDAIAGRARQYNLNSEASQRFERGVDPAGALTAMEFVTALLLELCGGEAGPIQVSGAPPAPRASVEVRLPRIKRVLGVDIPMEQARQSFTRLGLAFREQGSSLHIEPPTHRFDLAIEADFIEEVARLVGYDAIPGIAPTASLHLLPAIESQRPRLDVARTLVARDFQEVVTYSFVDRAWERDFAANENPVEVINPIAAQMAVMRSTLWGGLIGTLTFNLKRRQERVRLFEIGRVFHQQTAAMAAGTAEPGKVAASVEGYRQPVRLGLLIYGAAAPEQWDSQDRKVDFYDLKADLEALLPGLRCRPEVHPALHPGRSAVLLWQDQPVGFLGELHPALLARYDLPQAPVLAEIDWHAVASARIARFEEPSRFPSVRRDLAVVVDEATPVQALLDALEALREPLVRELAVFDLYRGKGLPDGKKSVAFRIVIQDTQGTLTDSQIESITQVMTEMLSRRFDAQLRK